MIVITFGAFRFTTPTDTSTERPMYADPTHIRDNEVKLRFNDDELALIEALARYNKRQRAVLLRDLVLAGVAAMQQKGIRRAQSA